MRLLTEFKGSEEREVVPGITNLGNKRKVHSGYSNMFEDLQRNLLTARRLPVKNVSYDVDPLDIEVIQPCQPLYDSRTIFHKGYKSRVRFYSVLDPKQTCGYISEVLDAELKQPLFKISCEEASYDVDLLDIGVIQPCKPWYDSWTIFPKGYKICVTFYSVLYPTQACSYISGALDDEVKQPLFKIHEGFDSRSRSLGENTPSPVAVHVIHAKIP